MPVPSDAAPDGCPPSDHPASKSWLDRRLLPIALGLTLLPLVISAVALIVGVGDTYLPTADHALIEMRVKDLGRHEVLVGLYSRADWSHPGPALFYALAPLYWVTGGASIATNLGALLINGAAITGMALIARRRGGRPLMLCTLLCCSLVVRTLGADFVHDPWNNDVTVLTFGLMIFLAWSLTCGDVWALPAATAVASFLSQTHVGFTALAMPLLAWGTAGLGLSILRARQGRGALIRSVLASVALLGVLWLPPLLDVLSHAPSNLSRILDWFGQADEGTHTLTQGWRVVSGQFELRPEWLTERRPLWLTGETAFMYSTPRPWLLALPIVATWLFWRRSQGEGVRLGLTVLAAMSLGVLAVAQTVGPAFDYRLRWTWMVATVATVMVLWAAWLTGAGQRPVAATWLGRASIAGLLVLTTVNGVGAARAGTPYETESTVLAQLVPPVLEAVGSAGGDVLVSDSNAGSWYTRGMVLHLERHGVRARVPPDRAELMGRHRVHRRGPLSARLVVAVDGEVPDLADESGMRLLARWDSVSPATQRRVREGLAQLDADFHAGRVTAAEQLLGAAALRRQLQPQGTAFLYSVAVFLDERA